MSFAKVLLFLGLYWPLSSWAEVLWLEGARNCDDFATGVLRTIATVPQSGASPEQKGDMQQILRAACLPPFDACNFSVCRNSPSPEASPTVATPESPEEALLPWMKEGMTCNEFLGELRTRYEPQSLQTSEELRRELRQALNVACGERFAHCKFEACGGK